MRRMLGTVVLAILFIACDSNPFSSVGGLPANPNPNVPDMYTDVWASGPDNVWVIGSLGHVVHYDGAQWETVETPDQSFFAAVWGTAPDNVWFGGGDRIAHWDGIDWTVTDFDTSLAITDIDGSAADDVWAVGDYGTGIHYDGNQWTEHAQGADLDTIWVGGPTDAWGIGTFDFVHWNGASFEVVEPPDYLRPEGIWGSSSDDVWVVDDFGCIGHFDGNVWTVEETDLDLSSLSGTAADDIWGLGDAGIIAHYDGDGWSRVQGGRSYTTFLSALHATPTDVWAVGWKISGMTPVPLVLHQGD